MTEINNNTYRETLQTMRAMLRTLVLLLALTVAVPLVSYAQLSARYTKEHPLIVVCNANFPPYEYHSDDGSPEGYYIDVIKTILDRLDLPYHIVMKEWSQAAYLFDHKEADLMVDILYRKRPYLCFGSRSVLDYYKLRVVSAKDAAPITTVEELKQAEGVVMRKNDFFVQRFLKNVVDSMPVSYLSAREALVQVANNEKKYFLWGERPLQWCMDKMGLEDKLVFNDLVIMAAESHFIGYDKELVAMIDDQYARIDQNGELQKLWEKWFHPEEWSKRVPLTILGITVIVVVLVLLLFYINRNVKRAGEKIQREADDLKHMMQLSLKIANNSVIEYDIVSDRFYNKYDSSLLPEKGVTMKGLLSYVHPLDQPKLVLEFNKLESGEISVSNIDIRMKPFGSDGETDPWQFIHYYSLSEKNAQGKVRYLFCAVKNYTKEYEEEHKDREMASRYAKIFEYTLVAMSFYNKDGQLIDLNRKMRELCEIDSDDNSILSLNLFDFPLIKGDFSPSNTDGVYACQHLNAPGNLDKYIEFRILPMYNNGVLQHYVMTALDITYERKMYMDQSQLDKKLRQTNEQISQHERELNFLLSGSSMWVWRSELKTKSVCFMRTLGETGYRLSFESYMKTIVDEDVPRAMKEYGNMLGTDKNFNTTLRFNEKLGLGGQRWMAIAGMPSYDADGNLDGHFGVVRDITELMETQEKLKVERARAEESGKLKSVFLANMTHEIRTPLNAIVGFSDLLQVIDTAEERREFIRIIRNNCDMLIRLINDIIEASSINQGPLAIEKEDVDFAVAFNDICQSLAQRVQEPGVEFIVDNPYKSFKTSLDKGRMQQVITNFTTNAVKYTHEGHIKVGYRYENGGIYMYCEDTGAGIPKDKQASVFERFVKLNDYVQGTGLGLSICKNIAERCGGRVGVDSEGEGKGSTFWIWIPCPRLDDNPT